jgi:hypothetical protein
MNFYQKALLICMCLTYNVSAQQNLFNIPSGDLTPKGKWFFQQQINAYNLSSYESKSHFVWGLSERMEIGFNLVNLPVRFSPRPSFETNSSTALGRPVYPLALFTTQIHQPLNDHLRVSVGTQSGFNLFTDNGYKRQFTTFNYALMAWEPIHHIKLIGGGYFGNKYMLGGTNHHWGYMLGYEAQVYKNWYLMGDFLSGHNESSVTVLGLMYTVSPRFQLCLGKLIGFPNEAKQNGIVLELNILGFDFK